MSSDSIHTKTAGDPELGATTDLDLAHGFNVNEDRGIAAIVDLATAAVGPAELEPGKVHVVAVPAGAAAHVIDLDTDVYREHPRRTEGTFTVRTSDSLIEYLNKHVLPETELWADIDQPSVTAVIDAHRGTGMAAGWGKHRVVLALRLTDAWKAWAAIDGKLLPQTEFAEFIEQRTIDFIHPASADVLELAQSFQATKAGRFETSQRLASGETNLIWKEDLQATAGKSGQLTIPDDLDLALIPFEGGPGYRIRARLRYRIDSGALRLGVVLERPNDVLREAFAGVVDAIDEDTNAPIYAGPAPR